MAVVNYFMPMFGCRKVLPGSNNNRPLLCCLWKESAARRGFPQNLDAYRIRRSSIFSWFCRICNLYYILYAFGTMLHQWHHIHQRTFSNSDRRLIVAYEINKLNWVLYVRTNHRNVPVSSDVSLFAVWNPIHYCAHLHTGPPL